MIPFSWSETLVKLQRLTEDESNNLLNLPMSNKNLQTKG